MYELVSLVGIGQTRSLILDTNQWSRDEGADLNVIEGMNATDNWLVKVVRWIHHAVLLDLSSEIQTKIQYLK